MSCFKKAVGLGSIEYLSQLRINAACEALSSTEKKISEIAFACGYGNAFSIVCIRFLLA